MEYVWNEEKLIKLLNKDERLINKKYDGGLQIEIDSLRIALNIPAIRRVKFKKDIIVSATVYNAAKSIFDNNISCLYIKEPRSLTPHDTVKIARDTMGRKEKKFFLKLIRTGNLNFSKNKPQTFYLPYHHTSLINIQECNTISDSRNIMHELAHAMYSSDLKYEERKMIGASHLSETLPIFYEMLFIDRLDKHNQTLNEQMLFLKDYYERYKYADIIDTYGQSFALAEYLFMLSKTDKRKFNHQFNLFKEEAKSSSDVQIVKKLNVKRDELITANEKYLNLYRK